jgi:hydrogenase small subunit
MAEAETLTQRDKPDVLDEKIHVLWINAGLSCDGDSVSLTAASLISPRRAGSA